LKVNAVSRNSGGETKESRVLALDVMQRITQSRKTIGAKTNLVAYMIVKENNETFKLGHFQY